MVANLSEPIDRFWLSDSASGQTWVTDELLAAVNQAVEAPSSAPWQAQTAESLKLSTLMNVLTTDRRSSHSHRVRIVEFRSVAVLDSDWRTIAGRRSED